MSFASLTRHPTQVWFFLHHFRQSFRDTPSFPPPVSTARLCFISFINHHRRQLPVAEGLFAALIVATKHQLLRNTDCTRYKAQFFRFFLIRGFFRFYPNYFSLRALDFFTLRHFDFCDF